MACCAGVGRWWDGRAGVDEMVDGRVVVIFRGNVFVSPPTLPPKTTMKYDPLTRSQPRYVAMHTMQEDDMINTTPLDPDSQSSGMMSMNGYLDAGPSSSMRGGGGGGPSSRKPGNKEGRSASLVFAAVGGMLLPLLTQVGHAH